MRRFQPKQPKSRPASAWCALVASIAGCAALLGGAGCFGPGPESVFDAALHEANELGQDLFVRDDGDDPICDDTSLVDDELLADSESVESLDVDAFDSDGSPRPAALIGATPTEEALRREHSDGRHALPRHSKSRSLAAAKNSLPSGRSRLWLAHAVARSAVFSRPSLQILFCCWLV